MLESVRLDKTDRVVRDDNPGAGRAISFSGGLPNVGLRDRFRGRGHTCDSLLFHW